MSKIALSGNASGTGTLTIAAPNTSSDYTLTLPAETGTVTTSGSTPTFTGAVTAPGFIPNSSTVPTNGLYLPAANTPAWASNSTKVVSVIKGSSLALEGATPQAGTGVTFPATQSASTDANTLDDYEEGSWTPSITGSSGGTASGSYVWGYYQKIGNQVTVVGHIKWSNSGLTGNIILNGLPFSVQQQNSVTPPIVVPCFYFYGLTTSVISINGLGLNNSTSVDIYKITAAATSSISSRLTASDAAGGTETLFQFTYKTAS